MSLGTGGLMRLIVTLVLCLSSVSVFAYPTGLISCRNVAGLPDNTYEIRNVVVSGIQVPHIEINRHVRGGTSEAPTVERIRIAGFATVASSSRSEILTLAAVRLEFEGDTMVGCRQ